MSQSIVLTFVLLFGACIALICAVYVALGIRKKKKKKLPEQTVSKETNQ